MKYKFLGSEAEVGGTKLQDLGQPIELTEAVATELIVGGGKATGYAGAVALLPADQFDALGFTESELKRFAKPGPRNAAPIETRDKVRKGLEAVDAFRKAHEAPQPKAVVADQPEVPLFVPKGEVANNGGH